MSDYTQGQDTVREWALHFDLPTNPLPMNGPKGNQRARWAKAARIRRWTGLLARQAGVPPLGRCQVRLTWYVRTHHTRDVDNLAELEKRMFDGLVDAGIVKDDAPEYMTKHRATIQYVDPKAHGKAWMELWIAPESDPRDDMDGFLAAAGITLMPWQRELLDKATAGIDTTATTIALVGGRQAGRTTIKRLIRTVADIQTPSQATQEEHP